MLQRTLYLAILALSLSLFNSSLAYAEGYRLPEGTVISHMNVPYADEYYVKTFPESYSQTVSFPNPSFPVKKLVSTVTTYTYDAMVHFTSDGIKYSYPIELNSNTLLTFPESIKITDVSLSIGGRGFPDDAGHVGYEDEYGNLALEELPPIVPKGRGVCVAPNNTCTPLIKEELMKRGFTVLSTEILPKNLHDYDIVVLTDIGRGAIAESQKLKDYVFGGGGLVFLSGAAYWLQQTDHDWLGFSYAGYTGNGENAFIAKDNPFDTGLLKGDFLKQQAKTEHGAQYVSDVRGEVDAIYGSNGIYAYHTTYGKGKIYYQSDLWESSAGFKAANNIKNLLGAGIDWITNRNDDRERKYPLPKDDVPKPTPKLTINSKDESNEVPLIPNQAAKEADMEFDYIIWGLPVAFPVVSYKFFLDKLKKLNKKPKLSIEMKPKSAANLSV